MRNISNLSRNFKDNTWAKRM